MAILLFLNSKAVLVQQMTVLSCADSESFVRGAPTLTTFFVVFLVDEGREDPCTNVSGPFSASQRNAIKWRFAGVPMLAQH